MSERILEIVSEDGGKRFFNSSLEEIAKLDTKQATLVPHILGVGDVALNVPDLEHKVELSGTHKGFFVARLEDTEPEDGEPEDGESTYDDPLYYNFEVTGPKGIRRTVKINSIFTNQYEEDYSQTVEGLAYLGIGGLVLMTDEKELHCLFGPKFEHEQFIDMGYRSTENIRAYSSNNPINHIKSFKSPKGKHIFVDDLDYTVIGPGEVSPRSYEVYNVDRAPRLIGNIPEVKDEDKLPLICEDFHNLLPLSMDNTVYILQGDKGRINVYEILKIGTPEEKLARVKEIEVSNMPIQANLLQL